MKSNCSRCGALLPPGGNELSCPRCLLGLAFESPTETFGGGSFRAPLPHELAPAFPNLEILELIGQGGMGAVYRARHRSLDRIVALKILPPQYASRPDFAARFEREARALARLSHPSIVNIFDSGRAGDYYFLVMEFVDGVNLRQAIQAGAIEPSQALAIVPQICEALQYAHDQGIVHRDIKPENILLDRQGRVRIADFGLARMLDVDRISDTLTNTRQVMGTPRYMAPEQIEGAHFVDHRADIYSLGVIFYELLTGELPIGRFDAPSRHRGVDRRLDDIVFRTLEKRPDARYQQASQLKTDVESLSRSSVPRVSSVAGFYEYRSKTTLFGLPFVHIARGIDPRTRRAGVAKGIIAIGDSAKGVIAIGGFATGFLAIGGVAFGVLALGGVSMGLIGAVGGLALCMGVALGGGAFGGFAIGGIALGFTAIGGAAFGGYYLGGNGQTGPPPEALMMFPILVSVGLLTLLGPALLIAYGFARFFGGNRSSSFSHTEVPFPANSSPLKPPRINEFPPESRKGTGVAGVLALGCLGLMVFGGFLIFMLAFSMFAYRSQSYPASTPTAADDIRFFNSENDLPPLTSDGVVVPRYQRSQVPFWLDVQYGPDGPELEPSLLFSLAMSNELRLKINALLQKYYEEAQRLEEAHTTTTEISGTGGVRITVASSDPAPYLELEKKFWEELDPMLNLVQQQTLRQKLNLFPAFGPNGISTPIEPNKTHTAIWPSLLGWGGNEGVVEISKQGAWYRWKVECEGSGFEGHSAELPGELKRFLPASMLPERSDTPQTDPRPYEIMNEGSTSPPATLFPPSPEDAPSEPFKPEAPTPAPPADEPV